MKRIILITVAVMMLLAMTACVDKKPVTEPDTCTHENYDFVEVKSPTCTEDGLTQKVCLDCGAVLEENTTPAVGHVWMPKIDENGNTVQACALCGYVPETEE